MMTQSHDDLWRSRLSEYIDGELSFEEREAADSHLASCDHCRSLLRELQAVVTRLHENASDAQFDVGLASLWPGVESRLSVRQPDYVAAPRDFLSPWPWRLVAAGLLLAAGLAGGTWFGRAQCTGAIPWNSSAWVKAGLSALGIGRTPRAQVVRPPLNDSIADSVSDRVFDSVFDKLAVPPAPR